MSKAKHRSASTLLKDFGDYRELLSLSFANLYAVTRRSRCEALDMRAMIASPPLFIHQDLSDCQSSECVSKYLPTEDMYDNNFDAIPELPEECRITFPFDVCSALCGIN